MKSMKYLWIVLLLVTLTIGFSTVADSQTRREILVGASLPMSGPLAGVGREVKWAYEQAFKDINLRGGVFVESLGKRLKVRLVAEDNKWNKDVSAAAVEKLITEDNVDFLFGGADQSTILAGAHVAEKHHKYFHTATLFFPVFLQQKFQWATNFFFDLKQACNVPFKLWESFPAKRRPKNPALVMEDTPGGKVFGELFTKIGKSYGRTFVFQEPLPVSAEDYSPYIAKLKEAQVDAILLFASETDSVKFIRQMKENNFRVGYVHGWKGTWSGNFWNELGLDAQYVLTDGFWSMDFPYGGAKELGKRYHSHFGNYSVSVGTYYALAQILLQAVEKAGTLDGAAIRQAVLSNTFQTVRGPVKYDKNGLAAFSSIACQWWNGKQELVYPTGLAYWRTKLAPDWDHTQSMGLAKDKSMFDKEVIK